MSRTPIPIWTRRQHWRSSFPGWTTLAGDWRSDDAQIFWPNWPFLYDLIDVTATRSPEMVDGAVFGAVHDVTRMVTRKTIPTVARGVSDSAFEGGFGSERRVRPVRIRPI
jgi:hypothetical protein